MIESDKKGRESKIREEWWTYANIQVRGQRTQWGECVGDGQMELVGKGKETMIGDQGGQCLLDRKVGVKDPEQIGRGEN